MQRDAAVQREQTPREDGGRAWSAASVSQGRQHGCMASRTERRHFSCYEPLCSPLFWEPQKLTHNPIYDIVKNIQCLGKMFKSVQNLYNKSYNILLRETQEHVSERGAGVLVA